MLLRLTLLIALLNSTAYAEVDLFKGRLIEHGGLQLKGYTLEEYKAIALFEVECRACGKTREIQDKKLDLLDRKVRGLGGLVVSCEDIVASQDDVLVETDLLLRYRQDQVESVSTDRDIYYYAMLTALAVLIADLSYNYLIKSKE